MSNAEIRVAMVGGWGHQFVKGAFEVPETNARLVAVAADHRDEAAKTLLEQPWCPKEATYFDSFEKMLDETKPDLVSIGSQPACNAPIVFASLERDIHVISDKPIVNNDEELDKLKALVKTKPGVLLMTEFDMRTRVVYNACREVVRDGLIGEPVLITAQKSYRFGESRPDYYKTREGFPGSFAFIGCHVVDLAYYVTGLKYTSVQGLQGNLAKKDYGSFEDHATAMARLENGGTALFHVDYLRPAAAPTHGDNHIRIAGSKGVVEVRDEVCTLITQTEGPRVISDMPPGRTDTGIEIIKTVRGEGAGGLNNADSLYMAELILRFREAIDTGKKVALPTY